MTEEKKKFKSPEKEKLSRSRSGKTLKTDLKPVSEEHLLYVKKLKKEKIIVNVLRFAVLAAFLIFWELSVKIGLVDGFISSYPSEIIATTITLFKENNLLTHIGVTLYETFVGFLISVVFGYALALSMWWSERLKKVLEPYVVVLNSLPKIALGPLIIIWFGSDKKAIIAMAVLISIIVCQLTMLNGFAETDKDKILLMKSLGASKFRIMYKLVIPSSGACFVSMLKIALGMAWIGSIMGEYLVSKAGLGYLIVYGGQVFKLDLVMSATVILLLLSASMYFLITLVEKLTVKHK